MFFPADWRNNAKLRRCSWAARGVWIEIMGLLHDSDSYGILHWTLKEISLAVGCPLSLVKELADKGVLKGCDRDICEAYEYRPKSGRKEGEPVTLVNQQNGPVWYSSRMVRDEYIRKARGKSARFGDMDNFSGNPGSVKRHVANLSSSVDNSPKPPFGESLGEDKKLPNPSPKPGKSDGPSYSYSFSNKSISQDLKVSGTDLGENIEPDKSPENPVSRSTEIALLLREKGVRPITSVHPQTVEWATDERVTDAVLTAAVETARQYKPEGNISPNYLRPIVSQLLETPVPKAEKAVSDAWWVSNEGIDRKGRELGIEAKPMESYPEFRQRIFDEIRSQKGAQA